ncbi:histone-like nucleoid-structuring protein Lsr2 [Tomitella biformata]|uniref:histone-like nucleoid-structuring protein Lsr2 n=1 Tax=Tomitella biformata TaxID=630403 RepID=UPI000465910E|nr:Lsr2 family protein [Tomitella biformata]
MAQKVTVSMIDDIDGTPADQTVEFALDGITYEIDLSEANAAGLRESLATWVSHARRVGGRKKTGTQPAGQPGRGQSKAIRAWAQDNGFEISERGRIPHEVVAAYQKAH